MNVESLKSELQQVLDNDLNLRKEFNTLKRSLSDYRNQLIMRDEDCKRLEVTIEVLNTKLVVMERDNTAYKAELSSFKELRGSIREQLDTKQAEIDARLLEIQDLKAQLSEITSHYETTIDTLKVEHQQELESVKADYVLQIQSLKNNSHYVESGIRNDYEIRLAELSSALADKEQAIELQKSEDFKAAKLAHEAEIENLRTEFAAQLAEATADGDERVNTLKQVHEQILNELEQTQVTRFETMSAQYNQEIEQLRQALEEQRSTLTGNFNSQIESARTELASTELNLRQELEAQLAALESTKTQILNDTIAGYEEKLVVLVAEYEEKLANAVIHATSHSSKLNDELQNNRSEQASLVAQLAANADLFAQRDATIEQLNAAIDAQKNDLQSNALEIEQLQLEVNRLTALIEQTESERHLQLNQQIETITLAHNELVEKLNGEVTQLTTELSNLAQQFESATNQLAEAETTIETKSAEIISLTERLQIIEFQLNSVDVIVAEKEESFKITQLELENKAKEEIEAGKREFEKLLAENSQLISEIDAAQDKVEAQDYEISLLKAELEEIRVSSKGKSDYFKETLANKNFELTNLEANHAALSMELQVLKEEVTGLQTQLTDNNHSAAELHQIKQQLEIKETELLNLRTENAILVERVESLSRENEQLRAELQNMNESVLTLKQNIESLNLRLSENEAQLQSVSVKDSAEQDAFIDRLFKQIDELNDQRLALLDEKEQMANQLLKMNEVVGNISQNVESQKIDVSNLNNYRKNVILASNSETTDNQQSMKEQINDLVREIDKCIALLSA